METAQVNLRQEYSYNDMGSELLCPKCNEAYLHQRNVTVFHRSEDHDKTIVMQQCGEDMVVTPFPSRDTCNPSPRRQGLLLEFECEHCHYNPAKPGEPLHRLAIYQHKGTTYLEWQLG